MTFTTPAPASSWFQPLEQAGADALVTVLGLTDSIAPIIGP